MTDHIFGYARVSTKEQREDRQLDALAALHINPRHIYVDKQSGKDFERPMYRKLLRRLKKDDLLYVKSIDRLGRNYGDIVVLDMPLLDTRRGKDLMGTFLSDIVLQILSFVAENERTTIHQRQAEGIASARARGVRFGRPPKPLPDNFREMCRRWQAGEMTCTAAAKRCGMALTTFRYQAVKLYQNDTEKNVYRNV